MIVDSCLSPGGKRPAALEYLESIGVAPTQVVLIVVTHWHDDHIRGLATIVRECTSARVCLSSAFRNEEFNNFVLAFGSRRIKTSSLTLGADEMGDVLEQLLSSGRRPVMCLGSRRLLNQKTLPNGPLCEIWSLSPSDAQLSKALGSIAKQIPGLLEAKRRAPDPDHNDLSIAAWVSFGESALLLGADLEEPGPLDLGWSAVINDRERPQGRAALFKISHHGSRNGHHDLVWKDMLISDAVAVLTPYNKNVGLPTESDVQRITTLTSRAFSTSKLLPNRFRRSRSNAVQKTVDETVVRITSAQPRSGHVRVRFRPPDGTIEIAMDATACRLRNVLP